MSGPESWIFSARRWSAGHRAVTGVTFQRGRAPARAPVRSARRAHADFADAIDDPRDPEHAEHTLLEMVRARVYASLAGYGDENDHDLDGVLGTPTHHPADETGTAMPSSTLRAPVDQTEVSSCRRARWYL